MKVCSQSVAGLLAGVALGWTSLDTAGGGLQPQGVEYPLTRGIPGDQVHPALLLKPEGGWVLWQDAAVDGEGQGICALRLGPDGAMQGSPRRVNELGAGDQENPAITPLLGGKSLCVWQGGTTGFQRIFGRVLDGDGSPVTRDIGISTGNGEHQIHPAAVTLADGSVVVAWASYRQDGSASYDVYARRLSAEGELLGDEFQINASRGMNRRSPALVALPAGGFLAAWVTEKQIGVRDNRDTRGRLVAGYGAPVYSVSVVARAFSAEGQSLGGEQSVSESGMAANPVLVSVGDGRVYAAWTRRSPDQPRSRFDVYGRLLGPNGVGASPERLINVTTDGDQYRPRLAVTRHGVIAVWTSMGQDGSWEGVFGRWIDASGEPSGDEIAINTQSGGGQLLPDVAGTPDSNLLVAYSSNQPRTGYELFAQRLAPLLLRARPSAGGNLALQWPTVPGGVYQLQSSGDAKNWKSIGSTRTASGESDEVAVAAPGQMVLYRIVRVR